MAAPGCYGYATVCIKLYSYKCDMYAIRLPTACPWAWPGPGARQRPRPMPPLVSPVSTPPRPGEVAARAGSRQRASALWGGLCRGGFRFASAGRPVLYTRGGRSQDRWTVYVPLFSPF